EDYEWFVRGTKPYVPITVSRLEPLGHESGQIGQARGITPFVVIPGYDLDEVPVNYVGRQSIDRRGGRVALQVHRNQRFFGVVENLAQPAGRFSGFLEGGVKLFLRGLALEFRRQVHYRHRYGRHAKSHTVELALQVGQHEANGLRRAGGSWDDVVGRGTRAAQVLVGNVQNALVIGHGMNRRHQRALD